jgi:Ca-activated chloride channel family protein
LFDNSGITRGDVLLVSDGLSDLELKGIRAQLRDKPGQRVSVLAIGTPDGGPVPVKNGGFLKDRDGSIVVTGLQDENLRRVASLSGGVFATISASDIDINALVYVMESSIDERKARLSDRSTDLWRELGPWLILLALPFAALAFRRGAFWLLPLYLVVVPPDAQALDWQSMWRNNDQRADQLFRQGEHATAAELFDNPDWKAAAEYRAGDFAAALEDWQQSDSEDAAYNRANALAGLGRYEEALAGYDKVLEQNPGHEDARFNQQAIEDWLKQQQSQQQQEGDQQQQSEQEQQPEQQQEQDGQQKSQKSEPQTGNSEPDQGQSGDQNQAQQQQQDQQASQQQGQSDTGEQSLQQKQAEQQAQDETQANLDQQMSEQAAEQWLRKVPDDPGGLLRRKFIYQYRKRGGVDAEAQSW